MTYEKQEKSRNDLENGAKVTIIDWSLRIPLLYTVFKFESISYNHT